MGPVRYKIKPEVYPRFKYFSKRLESIVFRLQNLTADGKLATCISQGKEKLQNVIYSGKCLQEEIMVTVISNDVSIPQGFVTEIQVVDATEGMIQESVTKSNFVEGMKLSTKSHPHFGVCLMMSPTVQAIKQLVNEFADLGQQQQYNIIVYDVLTKTNYTFQDLLKASFNTQSVKLDARNKHIGQHIQYLLEDRVVEVLENVLEFACTFAPKPGVKMTKTLVDQCSDNVLSSLKCQYVVDDLDPEKVQSADVDDTEAMDTGGNGVLKPKNLTEQQIDELFNKLMLNFLTKKTKCVSCDYLAKKYGLSSTVVNELLNEGFYDFIKNYNECVKNIPKPTWLSIKKSRHQAHSINYHHVGRQQEFFADVENYVMQVLKEFICIDKFAFEVFGLLRKTKVPVYMSLPVYPNLLPAMQNDLLSLEHVVGCGTVYGKLTVHIDREPCMAIYNNIQQILSRYSYHHDYRVQILLNRKHHANMDGNGSIEPGNFIKAELTEENFERLQRKRAKTGQIVHREKIGTLGCFVGLRKTCKDDKMDCWGAGVVEAMEDGAKSSECKAGEAKADLYCITCAHCLSDCSPDVKVLLNDRNAGFRDLGVRELSRDDGQRIDIAAVRVRDENREKCEVQIEFSQWEFCDENAGDLVENHVFKRGAVTQHTEGVVISNNYQSSLHPHTRASVIQAGNETQHNFHDDYNILVDVIQGEEPQAAAGLFAEGVEEEEEEGVEEEEEEESVEENDENAKKLWLGNLEAGTTKESIMGLSQEISAVHLESDNDERYAFLDFESADVANRAYKRFKELEKNVKFVGNKVKDLDLRRLRVEQKANIAMQLTEQNLKGLSEDILDVKIIQHSIFKFALLEFGSPTIAARNYRALKSKEGLRFTRLKKKKHFSENGDSGAVVCYYGMDNTRDREVVKVASLLAGSIEVGDDLEGVIEWTYSCHLQKSLQTLCGNEYEILKPWDI